MPTTQPVALVTGASRGIGAEVARQLAAAGHAVIITARQLPAAQSVADSIVAAGFTARALELDINDAVAVSRLADEFADGAVLDVLINNAAAFADWSESATSADLDAARAVMDTNLFGTWSVIKVLLSALRRSPAARIVNVGSGSGSHGDPQFGLAASPVAVSYAVSKAALHALSVKLAVELASEGISVDVVDPGLTATAPGMEAMGARPVAEGAASVVSAVLSPAHGSGTFTRDGSPLPW